MDERENIGERSSRVSRTPRKVTSNARHEVPQGSKHPRLSPVLPAPTQASVEGRTPVVCPVCKGAGFLRRDVPVGHAEFGKAIKCQCRIKQQVTDLFGSAHIPEDYCACSFESYQRLPLGTAQQQAAIMVQGFVLARIVGGYEGRKRGLYLYGPFGVGKTGLALSALSLALDAGHSGLYLPTAALFDILHEAVAASYRLVRGYGEAEDKEEEIAASKLLRLVDTVSWLVLDDLGVECASRFVVSRMYRIIEGRRSQKGLYTIFTSNKDARGLAQHWREDLPGAVAFDDCERIIQRIGEYCTPVHISGQSLREKGS